MHNEGVERLHKERVESANQTGTDRILCYDAPSHFSPSENTEVLFGRTNHNGPWKSKDSRNRNLQIPLFYFTDSNQCEQLFFVLMY